MKKFTLFTVVAFAALTTTSCKKDRTCTCTDTDSSGSTIHTIVVKNATKKSVKSGACYSGTVTFVYGSQTSLSNRTCTIK